MITDSFDNRTEAIIQLPRREDAIRVDACIVTFSWRIEEFVLKHYACREIASLKSVCGDTPVYLFEHGGKHFALYKTMVGAPITVGLVEDARSVLDTDKFVVFGGAGCLDREIAHGKVMVPTAAYRDEGTSYHYAPAADYIAVRNGDVVAAFMEENGLPYVKGKTWTTDAFFRETRGNFDKRKADGCISVEMECAALQALCDFRDLQLYMFFTSGDLLDAPKWDERHKSEQLEGTQHDAGHFDIALALAEYVTK